MPANVRRIKILRREVDGDESILIVADSAPGEPIVASAVVWIHAHCQQLTDVYVRPDARGEGVGRFIVQAAITEASRAPTKPLILDVGEENHAALSLYQSTGFEERGRANGRVWMIYGKDKPYQHRVAWPHVKEGHPGP